MDMRVVLFATVLGLSVLALRMNAQAATEICPAHLSLLTGAQDANAGEGRFNYSLTAFSERSIDAAILADTDKGWFAWSIRDVPLIRKEYLVKREGFQYTYRIAESATLSVLFPPSTVIKHAWVANAKTTGETVFGWDARGSFNCDVPPDVLNLNVKTTTEAESSANGAMQTATGPVPVAYPVDAPFQTSACKTPFALASVPRVLQPKFPEALIGVVAQPAVVIVAVAINEDGKLFDSWILAGSGYPAMDAEALNAVKLSKYEPSTAYCRHIPGVYTVVEEYIPQ